jgi:hypothetical protein
VFFKSPCLALVVIAAIRTKHLGRIAETHPPNRGSIQVRGRKKYLFFCVLQSGITFFVTTANEGSLNSARLNAHSLVEECCRANGLCDL